MKIQHPHFSKVCPILDCLVRQCSYGYAYMLKHWGKYIIYEDTEGITQVLKVKDYREGRVTPLPDDWYDRLYFLHYSNYSSEKYQKDLACKTELRIRKVQQSFLFGGGFEDRQERWIANLKNIIDEIEEDSFSQNARVLLGRPNQEKSWRSSLSHHYNETKLSVSERWAFNSYQDSPSRNEEGILWLEDSLAKNEDVKKSEYYFPCIHKGMYICLDKKVLSLYVGNAMLYDTGCVHWEGDNYDWENYIYCFADAIFLYNYDFNKTKNELIEICQDDYEEDERYIYAYLLQEQLEILQNRSDSFFHTLKFVNGHLSLGGKPM